MKHENASNASLKAHEKCAAKTHQKPIKRTRTREPSLSYIAVFVYFKMSFVSINVLI